MPATAAVRTFLVVVALSASKPPFILTPAASDCMIGVCAQSFATRTVAVAEAKEVLRSLAFTSLGDSPVLLPIAELLSEPGGGPRVVDRLVAMPLALRQALPQAEKFGSPLRWATLAMVAGTAVYFMAALAIARVKSFMPSVPREVFISWVEGASLTRTGARAPKRVKSSGGASPHRVWERGSQHPRPTWAQAKAASFAADEMLRSALLDQPALTAEDVYVRGFADLIKPFSEEEVPLYFRVDGHLPSFLNESLCLVPFSTRVQPPHTAPLPKPVPQPSPPKHFRPSSLKDLLTPQAFDQLTAWYCSFGEWMIDLAEASARDPASQETQEVMRRRPHPLVIPRSGIVREAQGVVWDLRDGGRPKPLDFCEPIPTHLNLGLVRRWQARWPDYPDRELFSHLLDGVDFKVEAPQGMLLQPHLASLAHGMVSVQVSTRSCSASST